MPHLRSKEGVRILKRYVANWPSVLAVYSSFKKQTNAKFKDGQVVPLSKDNYRIFYGEIYRRHLQDHGFDIYEQRGKILVQTPDGLQLYLLDNNDTPYLLVFDEIYLMRIYGMPDLSNRIAIDIGASIGDTALFFCKRGARVYGYEIMQDRYNAALENIRLNHMQDRVTIFNEPATADRINTLIQKNGWENVFLKIDCEGCEYELVPRMDFSKITDVIMEYHDDPKPLLSILQNAGFSTKLDAKEVTIRASKFSNQVV